MSFRLPDTIYSPQDLKAIMLETHSYASWFSHNAVRTRLDPKHRSEPPALLPATKDLIRAWSAKTPLTAHSLDELMKVLEKYNASSPLVTITLAAPANNEIKTTLAGWCRENIAPDILVSFQFNSTILGGMVIRYGSHIFDWSFRRQILSAKSSFPEVLRRV